ncbi:hypothetical protein H0H81_011377 [Sphagnurus paluster]|uniref:Uncharacterized protein n=1 Tax=Sphagnurus paluster TaxID=117069 RepID=A0A9P7KIA9_9AGAR|nr:hypothetical protein H0H81_011377 [Sphagnurus paluster]
MPRSTERQDFADALEEAFIVQLMMELEEKVERELASSSDDESDSSGGSGKADESPAEMEESDDDKDMKPLSETLLEGLAEAFVNRYHNQRGKISKSKINLDLLLGNYKTSRPDVFQSYFRVTPACFDVLVEAISSHMVFRSGTSNDQMPRTAWSTGLRGIFLRHGTRLLGNGDRLVER